MGVGEPDEPAFPMVVEALAEEAGKPENRFYTDNGISDFSEAAQRYMKKIYGVDLDLARPLRVVVSPSTESPFPHIAVDIV